MHARLITAHVQPDQIEGLLAACGESWLPTLSRARGFRALYLLRGAVEPTIAVLVLWETQADAAASLDGTLHGRLAGGAVMEVVLRA
jgi:heme-degrading monooxygenase HmoA